MPTNPTNTNPANAVAQSGHTPTFEAFAPAWHGPSNGRGANQYVVQNEHTKQPVAWCDTLEEARQLTRKLNTHARLVEALEEQQRILNSLCHAVFDMRANHSALIDPRTSQPVLSARALLSEIGGGK